MSLSIRNHISHKTLSRSHNNRSKVINQKHINPDGHFEIWRDNDPTEIYKKTFTDAIYKWDEKQLAMRHTDRIYKDADDYIKKLKQAGRYAMWEQVVSFGKIEDGDNLPDEETVKKALKAYTKDFIERNKNHIVVTGAYYHADEVGVPHIHLDYFFIATNQTRGMETQISQDKGLTQLYKEQGIKLLKSDNKKCSDAFYTFQQVEKQRQIEIGKQFGIEAETHTHKRQDRRKQLDTYNFIKSKIDKEQAIQQELKGETKELKAKTKRQYVSDIIAYKQELKHNFNADEFKKQSRKMNINELRELHAQLTEEVKMTRQELREELQPLKDKVDSLEEKSSKIEAGINGMTAILNRVVSTNSSNPLMQNEIKIASAQIKQMQNAKPKARSKNKGLLGSIEEQMDENAYQSTHTFR